MQTFSVFILVLFFGVSSGTVDGEGLAKELTAIRDEIGKATGIKFSRVYYDKEIESVVKKFNRDCWRWRIPKDKEYRYFPATIKLSKDDQIDTQLVKDTLAGKNHPNPEVQKLLEREHITNKLMTPMMRYLLPKTEKIGCWLDISCSSPHGDSESEMKLAKLLGKSEKATMEGGCILGSFGIHPRQHLPDEKTLRKIAEYYVKNGLEEKLEKLLIIKTGGQASRQK